MVEVVPFIPAHQAGVVDVILPIQQQEFSIPVTLEAQPDLLDIAGFYQRDSGNFWVATHKRQVVGTIALLDIGNRQAALRKMFVREEYRGARFHVAKQLLATLLQWCERQQMHDVYLGTTEKFLAAHRFYEKNAFAEIPKSKLPSAFPIMSVDTKFYVRRR